MKLTTLVLVVEPSPKSQARFVIVPLELPVKVTANGFNPLAGDAPNAATSTTAPVPVTMLVLLPALLVVKLTALLKFTALSGANWTTTLVMPKPSRLNGVPEMMEKAPLLTVAVPLLKGAPPRLVTIKVACVLAPTAMVPKLIVEGVTASCGGVNPVPVTGFVLLPALLRTVTALLKLPALTGLKRT